MATLGLVLLQYPLPAGGASAQDAPVGTSRAVQRDVPRRVELSGTVVSLRAARVSTDLGGLVSEVKVDIGDRVERGAELVQLDAALAELNLKRAEAATREAEEQLADARREVRVGQRLARNKNLPQNELDAREARARIAAAALDRLRAEEARERERLRRHTIRAPFPGAVAERVAEEGEWVSPGAAVVELVEIDRLRIDVPVPQRYFPELSRTPEIQVRFDALPERTFSAAVEARVPVSDPTARTFTLRLEPETDGASLTPGMSVRVTLDLSTDERGVVIPRDAIVRYPDGRTTVFVVRRDGEAVTVAERRLELGRAFDNQVHARTGLEAGAEVVVRGNEGLRDGQRVRITGTAG